MLNPTAAILIIGDEILSGRTRDSNMHYLSCELTKIGIDLQEARFIPDNATKIIDDVRCLSSKYDYVFTSGGIGPTHDDITADCIAAAFETEISIREDAFKLLENYYSGRILILIVQGNEWPVYQMVLNLLTTLFQLPPVLFK